MADDLKAQFGKKLTTLKKELKEWFDKETESIDGAIVEAAPSGAGGSIISVGPAIDSKRVLDATQITEDIYGIPITGRIIKPGGYDSFEEMMSDLTPKLEKAFIVAKTKEAIAKKEKA